MSSPRLDHLQKPVLLVDDHPANLIALEAVLQPLALTLVSASSGFEAVQRASQQDFAAILMDVRMPGLDGFAACRRIRSGQRNQATPVLFLTADELRPGELEATVGQARVGLMQKPLEPDVLLARVRSMLHVAEAN